MVLGAIIIAFVAFIVGSRYQKNFLVNGWYGQRGVPRMMRSSYGMGMMGGKDGRFHRGVVEGQIAKIEGDTVTIQLPGGGTYTVTLDAQTDIESIVKGTRESLQVGQTISVYGGGPRNETQTVVIIPQ